MSAKQSRREPVPEGVHVTRTARKPEWRSDVGVEVEVDRRGQPRHRLATIGDSLTQGFQSGAIFNTDLSYPALIARELGWYDAFRRPHYPGFGGIPLNLELIVRLLEERFGDKVSAWELPGALFHLRQHLAEAEDWWDEGPGSRLPPRGPINHNLGIYGWDLRDALSRTADTAHESERTEHGAAIVPLVRNADRISAARVLDSTCDEAGGPLTPFQAAAQLSRRGTDEDPDGDGTETLIVSLGANNALGSVISLEVRWSAEGYDDLKRKAASNVWLPRAFYPAEWAQVVEEVRRIKAPPRHLRHCATRDDRPGCPWRRRQGREGDYTSSAGTRAPGSLTRTST